MALDELEREKHIDKKLLIESLEAGMASAFKKETGEARDINVIINPENFSIKVFSNRTVVAEVDEDESQICLEDALEIKKTAAIGDVICEEITPKQFSRIAAQTAKQVVMQRLNDAKKDSVYNEMSQREGEILKAIVRRIEANNVFVEISPSQMEGILMKSDQVPNETYRPNDEIKVYIKKVRTNNKNAQVVVSRSCAGFVKSLVELEVPEIRAGLVQVKNIVREAGYRTKIAVYTEDSNIDAIGACIGNRGVRINSIVAELNGEKIDVIPWNSDPLEFIASALSPAKCLFVQINDDQKSARVVVPDDKLSLAIGKEGQNVRLAAKLTGWKIDVKPYSAVMQDIENSSENAEVEKE